MQKKMLLMCRKLCRPLTANFLLKSVLSKLVRASKSPPFMSQLPVNVAAETIACALRSAWIQGMHAMAAAGAGRDLRQVILRTVGEEEAGARVAGLLRAPAMAQRCSEKRGRGL